MVTGDIKEESSKFVSCARIEGASISRDILREADSSSEEGRPGLVDLPQCTHFLKDTITKYVHVYIKFKISRWWWIDQIMTL